MRISDDLIRAWQRAPASWRRGLVASPIANPLRRLMNGTRGTDPEVFELAEPLHGCRMKLIWQLHKAFIFGTYEPQVVAQLQEIVKPGWTTLDVGAYLGYYSLLLSRLVGPAGKVIAFEALPEVHAALDENIRMNDCHNVVVENRAVARSSGVASLDRNAAGPLPSTATLCKGGALSVTAVSLDDYLRGRPRRVALAKIDVEGTEGDVLEGMAEVLRRDGPVLLIELHRFDQWGERHPALQFLRRHGYAARLLGPSAPQVHALAEPMR